MGVQLSLIYANGSAEKNRIYCTKADPEGFFEVGDINASGQGARTDLHEVIETIRSGASIEVIADRHPVELVKYKTGLLYLKNVLDKKTVPSERDITVTIYHGEGGTGKSQHVHFDAKRLGVELYILSTPNNGSLFYDGYTDQRGLLLDDFYGWIKPHDLFRVLDRYCYQINIKGGFAYARWEYVWITSNKPPNSFYSDKVMATLDTTAYNRRFHNIYRLDYYMGDQNAVCLPIVEKEVKKLLYKAIPTQHEEDSVQNADKSDSEDIS